MKLLVLRLLEVACTVTAPVFRRAPLRWSYPVNPFARTAARLSLRWDLDPVTEAQEEYPAA